MGQNSSWRMYRDVGCRILWQTIQDKAIIFVLRPTALCHIMIHHDTLRQTWHKGAFQLHVAHFNMLKFFRHIPQIHLSEPAHYSTVQWFYICYKMKRYYNVAKLHTIQPKPSQLWASEASQLLRHVLHNVSRSVVLPVDTDPLTFPHKTKKVKVHPCNTWI